MENNKKENTSIVTCIAITLMLWISGIIFMCKNNLVLGLIFILLPCIWIIPCSIGIIIMLYCNNIVKPNTSNNSINTDTISNETINFSDINSDTSDNDSIHTEQII